MTIDKVEKYLFFEGIRLRYGHEFHQYAEPSVDRRLLHLLEIFKTKSLIDVLKIVLSDGNVFNSVLGSLTINTTEFFRDPLFFRCMRERVAPLLETYSRISIWSAGCSTGEEIISLSILLREVGLEDRATIYATDINPRVLRTAQEGIYNSSAVPLFNKNYVISGGTNSPSDYYSSEHDLIRFHPSLLENIVFAEHSLATDEVVVEAHLILCRNVLIYFNRLLQNRALDLFSKSLVPKGTLGIGSKESLAFSSVAELFQPLGENLYSLSH